MAIDRIPATTKIAAESWGPGTWLRSSAWKSPRRIVHVDTRGVLMAERQGPARRCREWAANNPMAYSLPADVKETTRPDECASFPCDLGAA